MNNYYTIACYIKTGRTTSQYTGRISQTGTFNASEHYGKHYATYAEACSVAEANAYEYINMEFAVCDAIGNILHTFAIDFDTVLTVAL